MHVCLELSRQMSRVRSIFDSVSVPLSTAEKSDIIGNYIMGQSHA